MKVLIIKKILGAVLVVFILSILCFMLIHMLPGDPAAIMAGSNATPDMVDAIRERLGLNRPLVTQYLSWAKGMVMGDWGQSLIDGSDVLPQIIERLPRTLLLTLLATILSLCIAVPLSVTAASKHNSNLDLGITGTSILLLSVPEFWFGMLLMILFSVKLKLLPAGGYTDPSVDFGMFLKRLILPVLTTAICLTPGLIAADKKQHAGYSGRGLYYACTCKRQFAVQSKICSCIKKLSYPYLNQYNNDDSYAYGGGDHNRESVPVSGFGVLDGQCD